MTLETLVELVKLSRIIDQAGKELRKDIYTLINRVEAWSISSYDVCIDPRLISQALRISQDSLVKELLKSDLSSKVINIFVNNLKACN